MTQSRQERAGKVQSHITTDCNGGFLIPAGETNVVLNIFGGGSFERGRKQSPRMSRLYRVEQPSEGQMQEG
jgi:hypothetical protein